MDFFLSHFFVFVGKDDEKMGMGTDETGRRGKWRGIANRLWTNRKQHVREDRRCSGPAGGTSALQGTAGLEPERAWRVAGVQQWGER